MTSASTKVKTTVKRKPHNDGGVAISADTTRKVVKKAGPVVTSPTVLSVPASHVVATSALRDPAPSSQPTIKKQKTSDVTLSALNDSDVNSDLVDMEGLDNLNLDSSLIMNSSHLPLLSR
ncbi:hypothetical protein CRUP_028159 [Coryphaenoides rupestris]|nr:hypothetical protein CRUP_028159 [Coryphaenoides rupestris]